MVPTKKMNKLPLEFWRQNYSGLQEYATLNCYMFAKFLVAAPS